MTPLKEHKPIKETDESYDFLESLLRAEWNNELRSKLKGILAQLDETDQKVLHLRYYQGLSRQDAGKILSKTKTQIKLIEGRALRRIRTSKDTNPIEALKREFLDQEPDPFASVPDNPPFDHGQQIVNNDYEGTDLEAIEP